MKAWFLSFFTSQATAMVPLLTRETTAAPPMQGLSAPALHHRRAVLDAAFLAWMTHCDPAPDAALGPPEQQVLQRLAARVADPAAHASLLPRAAGVVPALLARLRSERSSLGELADHVSRDPTLVAEVVAMANSAFYRREQPVMELSHAIQMLGAEIARSQGRDPFDAYLLALLHDRAWSVVLRELDGAAPAWRLSTGFVTELVVWRDRLAGVIAQQWQPQGPWAQAAVELAQHGLQPESSAPVLNLCAADQLAWLLCDPDRARGRSLAEPWLDAARPTVRACFVELDAPTAAAHR